MSIEAYPLCWPEGWKRTSCQEHSRFKTGFGAARVYLSAEIARMGGTKVIISSDVPLRNDGMPRASAAEPKDSGVAVYFRYGGKDTPTQLTRSPVLLKSASAGGYQSRR